MTVPLLLALTLLLVPVAAVGAHFFAAMMRRASLGQQIRDYGPRLHEKKSGIPTMGGVVVLLLWACALLIVHRFQPLSVGGLFVLASGISFGGIGFLDDFLSLRRRRSLGLSPRQKILLSTILVGALFLVFPQIGRVSVQVPFSTLTFMLPPGLAVLLAWAVFLATTNGMNLTDGLDGLATGTTLIILFGYLLLFSGGASTPVILPLIGILGGFLWVNAYPARLFLGDTGSFAMGGVVAGLAVTSGTQLVLPLLAGLLVLETSSVIIQVSYYRFTGKRIFKISPLHHHFERAEGIDYSYLLPNVEWPEPKIVLRLWIVQGICVGAGVLATWL